MNRIEHSIDCLQVCGYVGEPIQDVINELVALKDAARRKRLKDVRVIVAPRTNLALIDDSVPVNPKLRLFVVGNK